MSHAKKPAWGSELPDDPAPVDAPIATTQGLDLARDMDSQVKGAPPSEITLATPLKTRLQKLEAVESGAGAAGILAVLNLLALFDLDHRPLDSLIGADPQAFVIAQLAAAALAVGLALLILTRHGLWACEAVLAWTVLELFPYETHYLYGHGISGRQDWTFAISALGLAMVGVRGAWVLRAKRKTKASPLPLP